MSCQLYSVKKQTNYRKKLIYLIIRFRSRIKKLEYTKWLYISENNSMNIREGFIRLDRIQVVEKCLIQPISVSFTADALLFVSEWLRYYLTNEIDPLFMEDRMELLQSS